MYSARNGDGRHVLDLCFPRLMAAVKRVAYRLPIIRIPLRPTYPYWVTPGTLATIVGLISRTETRGGSVVEVGVGRGLTSVFLLEHLKATGDPRSLILIDTFTGFTETDIDYELRNRNRKRSDLSDFSYGDPGVLRGDLNRLGYSNHRIIVGDCARVDWAEIGPIAAMLLDVDLYAPTKAALEGAWPHLLPGGGIVVDDCIANHWANGSLEACNHFIRARGLPCTPVDGKARLVEKPRSEPWPGGGPAATNIQAVAPPR